MSQIERPSTSLNFMGQEAKLDCLRSPAKKNKLSQKVKTAPESPISSLPNFPSPANRCISQTQFSKEQPISQSFLVTFDDRQRNLLLTSDTNETSCGDVGEAHDKVCLKKSRIYRNNILVNQNEVLTRSQSSAQALFKTPKSNKRDTRIPPLTSIGLAKTMTEKQTKKE